MLHVESNICGFRYRTLKYVWNTLPIGEGIEIVFLGVLTDHPYSTSRPISRNHTRPRRFKPLQQIGLPPARRSSWVRRSRLCALHNKPWGVRLKIIETDELAIDFIALIG
jgi:hypothetical protein